MESILVVDDNKDQRETNTIRLKLFLKELNSTLEVIDIFPFATYNDYIDFIDSQNIIALVIDEKLFMDSQPDKAPVDYNGSDLVSFIRARFKYIPVFTLTNYSGDPNLQEKVNEYDYIFLKSDFTVKQVQIIQRACHRFSEENKNELSLYDDLTKKIASGKATPEDIVTWKAIQVKLNLPFSYDLTGKEIWLKNYEEQIEALINLKAKLEKIVKK